MSERSLKTVVEVAQEILGITSSYYTNKGINLEKEMESDQRRTDNQERVEL